MTRKTWLMRKGSIFHLVIRASESAGYFFPSCFFYPRYSCLCVILLFSLGSFASCFPHTHLAFLFYTHSQNGHPDTPSSSAHICPLHLLLSPSFSLLSKLLHVLLLTCYTYTYTHHSSVIIHQHFIHLPYSLTYTVDNFQRACAVSFTSCTLQDDVEGAVHIMYS